MENAKLIYLKNSNPESAFRLSNGTLILNLEQLLNLIKSDSWIFYNHVTPDRNDFANWIRAVIGYSELADNLAPIKDRSEFISILEQAIIAIKNYVPENYHQTPVSTSVPIVSSSLSSPIIPSVVSTNPGITFPSDAVISPIVSPAEIPVIAPASLSPAIIPSAPIVVTPVSSALPSSLPPASSLVSSSIVSVNSIPVAVPDSIVQSNVVLSNEQVFDFEDVFRILIIELEQEILLWE